MMYDSNVAQTLGLHIVDSQGEYCMTCDQDAVTCQVCGHRVCGNTCKWVDKKGNVCSQCSFIKQD